MSTQSRKARGMRTQLVATHWFQRSGWEHAESAGSGRPGIDILGLPGLSPEVKARRGFNLTGWLKQAINARGNGLPFVIVRPDGMGEKSIAAWPVVLTLADFTDLLREAGYGDPNPRAIDIGNQSGAS